MILGHIPAGYIFSKLTHEHTSDSIGNYHTFLWWGILGAIAPDLDLLRFYFVDHGRVHHHEYFTHYPLVWLSLIILSITLLAWKAKRRPLSCYMLIFSISGFIHLALDTIGGDIWWLAPFVDRSFSLITILPRFHIWQLNFLLHWSFTLELVLVVWAIWLWSGGTTLLSHNASKIGNSMNNRRLAQCFRFNDRHVTASSPNRPS